MLKSEVLNLYVAAAKPVELRHRRAIVSDGQFDTQGVWVGSRRNLQALGTRFWSSLCICDHLLTRAWSGSEDSGMISSHKLVERSTILPAHTF